MHLKDRDGRYCIDHDCNHELDEISVVVVNFRPGVKTRRRFFSTENIAWTPYPAHHYDAFVRIEDGSAIIAEESDAITRYPMDVVQKISSYTDHIHTESSSHED